MPLSFSRVQQVATEARLIANERRKLHARIKAFLTYNSNQAIDLTPATKTFTVANATDVCTANAHGLANGQKVRVTSSGVIPGGLAGFTDYYLRDVTANTFKLATSVGGTAINITDDGSGTHTLHPVPAYITEDAEGNLSGFNFSRAALSNVIGSLDWDRKLMENESMAGSQGDHLGNINQLGDASI